MTRSPTATEALDAYEALAPHYDQFTAGYQHDRWLAALETLALRHHLPGKRLFDVGCGTGKSFMPLLDRGYQTTACDLSPKMVDIARATARGRADVFVADMRRLPTEQTFDLITCLDDAINYLTSSEDLLTAVTSMAACLAPGGLLIFDATTLTGYRSAFSATFQRHTPDVAFQWKGTTSNPRPGGLMSAVIQTRDPHGRLLHASHHLQRHHRPADIRRALAEADLELCATAGQLTGATLETLACENRHPKIVWLARRPHTQPPRPQQAKGETPMSILVP